MVKNNIMKFIRVFYSWLWAFLRLILLLFIWLAKLILQCVCYIIPSTTKHINKYKKRIKTISYIIWYLIKIISYIIWYLIKIISYIIWYLIKIISYIIWYLIKIINYLSYLHVVYLRGITINLKDQEEHSFAKRVVWWALFKIFTNNSEREKSGFEYFANKKLSIVYTKLEFLHKKCNISNIKDNLRFIVSHLTLTSVNVLMCNILYDTTYRIIVWLFRYLILNILFYIILNFSPGLDLKILESPEKYHPFNWGYVYGIMCTIFLLCDWEYLYTTMKLYIDESSFGPPPTNNNSLDFDDYELPETPDKKPILIKHLLEVALRRYDK